MSGERFFTTQTIRDLENKGRDREKADTGELLYFTYQAGLKSWLTETSINSIRSQCNRRSCHQESSAIVCV
ncbi:unnamed protein product [Leuciscus chuanchicus]